MGLNYALAVINSLRIRNNIINKKNMWINRNKQKPYAQGMYNVYGTINKGSEFEQQTSFTAFWNGEKFTDKDGEDLIDLDKSITHWFDIKRHPSPVLQDFFNRQK